MISSSFFWLDPNALAADLIGKGCLKDAEADYTPKAAIAATPAIK